MRTCIRCGNERPLDQFRSDRGERRKVCNPCRNQNRRASYDPDKNRQVTQKRAWVVRAWRYGVTEEFLLQMLAQQDGLCAICDELMSKPCVDHDHDTGFVRGLLCHKCNNLLGHADDSVARLETAKRYLLCCQAMQRNSPSQLEGVKTE